MQVGESPVFRLALPILPFPLSCSSWYELEVSFLQHFLNSLPVESENTIALIQHPGEGYVGYVTRCMVIVTSSYVGMHARKPTLLETSVPLGIIVTSRWEVPECGSERLAMLVQR